jgi:tetratricopeptide (TPR) repeat protein/tRNA A-37 threonylcarbamoyl transferase component Bud32
MLHASTDRNLLAGALALQMEFVTQHQLATAMKVWVADKNQPLEQILVAQGALDAEAQQLLEGLVRRHLRQHGGDLQRSLRRVRQFDELAATVRVLNDPHLNETLARTVIPGGDPATSATLAPSVHPEPCAASRYRILRPHAKGGLGQVSVAVDEELHREVALKEIQSRYADNEDSRARFVQEAEVTGGLEHPGIVPVYGLGHYPDGRPYYAMRFIRGESLRAAIHQYHHPGADPDPGARSVQFRGLLNRFITVCQTMEYAHSRGVVHRDIKPDNIMLGKYGETLVVDWGLAKQVGCADHPRSATTEPEELLRLNSGSGTNPTLQGTAVGTPAYMSPEQAAGRLDEIGPASDIYSLGATLYAILTGKPPVEGSSPKEIMIRVQRGDIVEPRTINPQIDHGLQAICLKALAHHPADRYATAADLAHDLEQWMADEPIAALPDTLMQQASRWGRRHRAWVRAGIGTLAAVTLASLIALIAIHMAWEETQYLHEQAKELALRNARLAQENDIAKRLAEKHAAEERLERERAVHLANQHLELADKHLLLAEEHQQQAEKATKLAEFLTSLFPTGSDAGHGLSFFVPQTRGANLPVKELLQRGAARAKDAPELADSPLAKAAIMNTIGDLGRQFSLWNEALPLLEESRRIREELLDRQHPDLAASYHNLGCYHHQRGDYETAERCYEQALAVRSQLPGVEGKLSTAATLLNLAWLLADEGESKKAIERFEEVLALHRELPDQLQREVAIAKFGIALTRIHQGNAAQALPLILAAQDDLQKLESNDDFASALGRLALGVAYRNTRDLAAAEAQLRSSLEQTIHATGPDSIGAAIVEYELAVTLAQTNDAAKMDEANRLLAHCVRIADEQLQFQHPRICLLVDTYANFLARRGQVAEGAQLWERFVPAQRQHFGPDHKFVAHAEYEQASYYRRARRYAEALSLFNHLAKSPALTAVQQAEVLHQIGRCYLDGPGDNAHQAVESFRQSIVALEAALPEGKERRERLLFPRVNLALALLGLKEHEEAERLLDQTIADAQQIGGEMEKNALCYAYQTQAQLYRSTGNFPRLLEVAQAHAALVRDQQSDLFEIAATLANTLRDLPKDEAPPALREQFTAAIFTLLRDLYSRGYRNSTLLQNANFQPLQADPTFQTIAKNLKGE